MMAGPARASLALLLLTSTAAYGQDDLAARVATFRARDRALRLERVEVRALRDRVVAAEDAWVRLQRELADRGEESPQAQARLRLAAGRFDQAQRDYEAAVGGELAAARAAEAEALAAAFGALLADLDAAIAAAPPALDLRLTRAELYADKGRFDRARRDAEALVLARPTDARVLVLLGRCLIPENRFVEALGLFEQAHELAPSDLTRCYRAIALYCLNRFDQALVAREAIQDVAGLPPELQQRCAWWLSPSRLRALAEAWRAERLVRAREAEQNDLPRVALRTPRGRILLELFEDDAPNTTAAFLALVGEGFYDGLSWHRVVPNLMAQTGDPATHPAARADGPRGNPGYRLPDETSGRTHFRGSLALARARGGTDSGGSQVFLSVIPAPRLDGRHTVFGRILEGLEVLDRLREGDRIEAARVVRKRDHPYPVETLPLTQGPPGPDRR